MKVAKTKRGRLGRRQARLLASVVGLCGLIAPAFVPTAAHAAPAYCTSGAFCIWEDIYGWGRIARFIQDGGFPSFSSLGLNDVASSAQNLTSVTYCLYWDENYAGRSLVFPPGSAAWDLRQYGWNDKASSLKPC